MPRKGHVCRVSDLRTSTTDDDLRAMLAQTIKNHLSEEENRGEPDITIVPDCYNGGNERIALVEFPVLMPEFLRALKENPVREVCFSIIFVTGHYTCENN